MINKLWQRIASRYRAEKPVHLTVQQIREINRLLESTDTQHPMFTISQLQHSITTITRAIIIYGQPSGSIVISKEAAIDVAREALERGQIMSYYVEEESETTGRAWGTIEIKGVR